MAGLQLGKWVIYGKMSHTLKQMDHTYQKWTHLGDIGRNGSHLGKQLKAGKMSDRWINGLLLENSLTSTKITLTLKNWPHCT